MQFTRMLCFAQATACAFVRFMTAAFEAP